MCFDFHLARLHNSSSLLFIPQWDPLGLQDKGMRNSMTVQERLVQKYIILSFAFSIGMRIGLHCIVSIEYSQYIWILKPENVQIF